MRRSEPHSRRGGGPRRRSAAPLGQTLEFLQLLWAVDHGLTQVSKRMGRAMGVTGLQRLVVRLVGRRPGISAGELAGALRLHPSTLTGVLRLLAERGLLRRSVDESDARRARLHLTASGWRVDALRAGTVESRVRRAIAACAPRDLAATRRVLLRVSASLARP
jgi:DNA-binding MarR family transcriptional regulator